MSEVRLRDFSRKVSAITFTADGDEFNCVPGFTPEGLQELLVLAKSFDAENPDLTIMRRFFEMVLFPDSFDSIGPRLDAGAKNPMTMPQCTDIMSWLVEEYGQRPTTPSSNSTTPSETESGGISSMDGALREVSIL